MTIEPVQDQAAISSASYEFDAVLYPHRSLSPQGFLMVMLVYVVAASVLGWHFMQLGAWPISLFFVPALAFIWLAFRVNYKDGLMCETVRLSKNKLVVEEYHPFRTIRKRWEFNPAWVQVSLDHPVENDSAVEICERGEGVSVGAFLSAPEKEDFRKALQTALNRIKVTG